MQPLDRPVLYAALICERASLDEDGVPILFRVVDTFTLEETGMAAGTPAEIPFSLFTKWGGPAGRYTERISVINPQSKEQGSPTQVTFELRGGHHFQQIRHFVTMKVEEPGVYHFRIYLDGPPYVEVPLRVNTKTGQLGG